MNIDTSIFYTKYGFFKAIYQIHKILDRNPEIKEYLENLYADSTSINETIYRYKNHINQRPVCMFCGKPATFHIRLGFILRCDDKECKRKYAIYKSKKTKLEKYGDENYRNFEKIKQTKLERYGDPNYNNRPKMKQTKFERYGDPNYNNYEKNIQTKFERYGEYFVNEEKRKATKKLKYGDENYVNKEKAKETYKQKTGYDYNLQNPETRKRIKETKIKQYGFYYVNSEKAKQTKLEKYGDENYNNREQAKITIFKKYGSDNYYSSEECIKKSHTPEALEKINISKRKNHTFNASKPENIIYNELKDIFGDNDVKTQYKSPQYPFNCDFYIKSIDTYIECNFHWTHGGKIYEGTEDDINKVNLWKSKNTQFYNNAINTWTIRDVNKIQIAKNNKLNYIIFYNIIEYNNWINKYKNNK